MKNETLFFILGIYIFTLFFANSIIAVNAYFYCSNSGMRCFISDVKPCCHETEECRFISGYYECANKVTLGSYCEFDGDCFNIRYAKCSYENECICNPNYLQVNESTCGILLGNFCNMDETCAMKNSKCIDNECQCSKGFVLDADKENCVPRNYGFLNTIKVVHSRNEDTLVYIDAQYQYRSYLGMACKNDLECESVMHDTICLENKCQCQIRYIPIDNNACGPILEVPCFDNDTCATAFSICIDNVCRCRPNFSKQGFKCLPKYLGGPCREYKDCAEIEFSECSTKNRCVCLNRYVNVNETTCRPILEGLCSEDDQCIVENSICIDATCQCKPHYSAIYKDMCILSSLGKFCHVNAHCDDGVNLKCSDEKKCVCKDRYSLFNGTCVPVSNGFCLHDFECKFNGFHCVDHKCQCKPNFTLVSEHQCIETNSVTSCINSIDCGDLWHAKCINNKCVCSLHHIAINNATCYPISGGLCWTDHQCPKENFDCIDFHCRCKADYVLFSDNSCIPNKLLS